MRMGAHIRMTWAKSEISKGAQRGDSSGSVGGPNCPFARSGFKGVYTAKLPSATTHLGGGLKW